MEGERMKGERESEQVKKGGGERGREGGREKSDGASQKGRWREKELERKVWNRLMEQVKKGRRRESNEWKKRE